MHCVQKLLALLKFIFESDANTLLQMGVDDDKRLDFFFCQTTAMKRIFQMYPEALFVDATYRFYNSCVIWQ